MAVARGSAAQDDVVADYRQALVTLATKFGHCQGEGLFSRFRRSKQGKLEVVARSWVEVAMAGPRGRVEALALPSSAADPATLDGAQLRSESARVRTIGSFNPSYSFSLEQRDRAMPLAIRSLDAGPRTGSRAVVRNGAFALAAPVQAYLTPVTVYLGLKQVRFRRVPIDDPQDPRLKLEFANEGPPGGSPGARRITSGWLVVDPRDGWCLQEYGVAESGPTGGSPSTSFGRILYARDADGQPRPAKVEYGVYDGHFTADPAAGAAVPVVREELEFKRFRFGDLPEREFTLGAFGLPEFGQTAGQVEARRSAPWWLAGLAVGFAVLAVALRRLARRGMSAAQVAG